MCKGGVKSIEKGDLVSYRTAEDIQKNSNIKNGIGIVITIHENFVKVYWLYAKNYLWIAGDRLISLDE